MVDRVVKNNLAKTLGFLLGFGVTLFVLLFLVTAPFNPVAWIIVSVVAAIVVGYIFNKLAFALYGYLSNTSKLPDDALAKNEETSPPGKNVDKTYNQIKQGLTPSVTDDPPLPGPHSAHAAVVEQKNGDQAMWEVEPPLKPIAPLEYRIPYRELKFGQRVGEESGGTVCSGHWNNQPVAIKLLSTSLFGSMGEELAQEITALSRLKNPGIVQFLGVCLERKSAYLVMEWMRERSLYDYLNKNKLEPRQQKEIALDIVKGLHYLHEKGLINKNLRSRNILLTEDCRAKISDFGLAKIEARCGKKTMKRFTSSVPWWAPELLDGSGEVAAKADIYSLGVILWELFTGKRPFAEEPSKRALVNKIVAGHREQLPKTLPQAISDLIADCWSAKPSERPELTEIMKRLEAYEPAQLQTAETRENEEKTLGK